MIDTYTRCAPLGSPEYAHRQANGFGPCKDVTCVICYEHGVTELQPGRVLTWREQIALGLPAPRWYRLLVGLPFTAAWAFSVVGAMHLHPTHPAIAFFLALLSGAIAYAHGAIRP